MNLLDNEPARLSSGQRPKLPVLFHLLDVSRPRAAPLPADPPPAESGAAARVADLPPEPLPSELLLSPPPVTEAAALTSPADSAPESKTENATVADGVLVSDAPAPADSTAPPPVRSQSERRRKAKTPASEEWFATHGKYIAIAFVVALAATIYVARTNRRTPPVAETEPPPLNIEPGDSAQASREYRPDAAKGSTTVVGDSSLAAGMRPSSPARLIETASASAPQAELFPPTTPPAPTVAAAEANKPAADSVPSASQSVPPLVASRSAPQEANQSPPVQTPADSSVSGVGAAPPSPPASAYAPAPPALEPSYPTTGYPTTGLPAANYPTTNPPPPPSYPTTGYQPAFSPQPAVQRPPMVQPAPVQPAPVQPGYQAVDARSAFVPPPTTWTQPNWQMPPPPGGQPAPYTPSVNPAPGTRYERSGSGLYQGLR